MNALISAPAYLSPLTPRYVRDESPQSLLGPHTLALFGFGAQAPASLSDPRYINVGLQPADDAAWYEVWESASIVNVWRDGTIGGASNDHLSFGWIECEEGEGGIASAAEEAYRRLLDHVQSGDFRHLLRIWNYLDAITEGDGDDERYRQFCAGRAVGFTIAEGCYPAATAIGRRDGRRMLQVYWLSAARLGIPLENPRQVAAWRYPRRYGPQAPTFARAMLAAEGLSMPLMLSGTAAVVGHASQHLGDIDAQLDETMRNFATMIKVAREHKPGLPECFDGSSLLKIYLSDLSATARVNALLDRHLSAEVSRLVLQADVCRSDLALEIDGFHGS